MTIIVTNLVEHGSSNPIVARLSAQVLDIAGKTTLSKEHRVAIGAKYLDLMKRLLVCYEIRERFRSGFNMATLEIEKLKAAQKLGQAIVLPQISRLEEEARNFVTEGKSFVRELLGVVNLLYGTNFEEASEFTDARNGKKGAVSLIQFAQETFGENDARTKTWGEAGALVKHVVALRNAVEHPDGRSGRLVVRNFTIVPEGIDEPTWHREKDGQPVHRPASIRAEYDIIIDGLLTLGEDVFVSWAALNLRGNGMIVMSVIPKALRNPDMPVKYRTTLRPDLAQRIAAMEAARKGGER